MMPVVAAVVAADTADADEAPPTIFNPAIKTFL
jgi:hypothetical protein